MPLACASDELVIAVVPVDAPLPGSVSQAYEFLPTGTEFNKPVTVSFAYTDDELAGQPPSAFAVSTVSDDSWQAISKPLVDSFASVISGMTTHFSPYALVATSENGSAAIRAIRAIRGLPAALRALRGVLRARWAVLRARAGETRAMPPARVAPFTFDVPIVSETASFGGCCLP